MGHLAKWSGGVIQGLDWLDGKIYWTWWLFILIAFYFTFEVLMRYLFNRPHSWFEETSIILCVLVSFLGTGRATRERMQIVLPLVYVRLNQNTRRIVDIIISIFTIVVSVFIAIAVIEYAAFLDNVDAVYLSSLRTPVSLMCYPVIVGMALNALFGLRALLQASFFGGLDKADTSLPG